MIHALVAVATIAFAASARAESASPPSEPEGYRMENYRAPAPATLKGAAVIDTATAFDLWRAKTAAFIDALPHAPKPEGLPKNVVWRGQPRFDVPGSVWLPDTGYGALSETTERYLIKGLAKASGGDTSRPLVFYCLADCWMSWNAAKRALKLGYTHVLWYPEGTDGWAAAKHPLEEAKPEPRE